MNSRKKIADRQKADVPFVAEGLFLSIAGYQSEQIDNEKVNTIGNEKKPSLLEFRLEKHQEQKQSLPAQSGQGVNDNKISPLPGQEQQVGGTAEDQDLRGVEKQWQRPCLHEASVGANADDTQQGTHQPTQRGSPDEDADRA